ncbi:MAG TPA: hypothetical protein VHV78_07400, partial [Gemmatimonadaceae bacterium]|nr:hypothetical protein [Gemmatimonadaceae bacterium]
ALFGASACAHRDRYDPCEASTYVETACDSAVVHHGYWYGGAWYPRVYSYAPFWYYNRYNSFVSTGGIGRSLAPTMYVPSSASATSARASVVRGGFGGIGEGHASAGS